MELFKYIIVELEKEFQDIIYNEELALDSQFHAAFVRDITLVRLTFEGVPGITRYNVGVENMIVRLFLRKKSYKVA